MLLRLKSTDTLNHREYLLKVYAKLVKCNFDGASVIRKSISGIKTRMKERRNGLVYMHCTAHQLELVVRDSTKFDNYLDRFDKIINNIFKFYYYSPLHRQELSDLPLLNLKQFGLLKNIRWFVSRSRALIIL